MASTYSSRIRLEKPADGEQDDTWGATIRDNLDLIDEAIDGYLAKSVAGGSDVTLTSTNGASDESRQAVLKLTGALTADIAVIVPATEKRYVVWNATTGGYRLTFKPSGGTGLVVPQGLAAPVFTDGTTMYRAGPWTNPDADSGLPGRNLLPNGDFRVAQRGTSFTSATTPANNDDTYLLDGCILLSNGNDIADVVQDTALTPKTYGYATLRAQVEIANWKFGFLFPIEARDAAAVIGQTASLSFQAKKLSGNVTLENIRAAVLAWSGTADSITSDAVTGWNSAGSNPTLAANWTYENTPATITLSNDLVRYTIPNIAIDTASATNVAVFIWIDDTDATVDDIIYIADVQLEPGALPTAFERRPFGEALARCQRYFAKTFPHATAPAQNAGGDGALQWRAASDGKWTVDWRLPVEMRVAPTLTTYNPAAANANARNNSDSTDVTGFTTAGHPNSVVINKASGAAADATDNIALHVAATAEL